MPTKDQLEDTVKRLDKTNRLLKSQIKGLRAEPIEERPLWSVGFSPNEVCLLVCLAAAYPKVVDKGYMEEEVIPKLDHAADREKAVEVLVSNIRRKAREDNLFPFELIKTHKGLGYQATELFARLAKLAAETRAMQPSKRAA